MTQYIFLSGLPSRTEALACAQAIKQGLRAHADTHLNIAIEEFESPLRETLITLAHQGSVPDTDLTDPSLRSSENILGATNEEALGDLKNWLTRQYGPEVIGRISLSYAEEVGEFFSHVIYIDAIGVYWPNPFEARFPGDCVRFGVGPEKEGAGEKLAQHVLAYLTAEERTTP